MSSKREERKKAKMIDKMEAEVCEYNKVKKPTNAVLNVILAVMSLISILPFIFVVIISLTDEQTLAMNGYQFVPEKLSLYAYHYIISAGENILRSYGVTILVTTAGTVIGLFLTGTYAYALSRKTYAFKKFFTTVITIPMLFSGGMVANYLIVTKVLMLKDSIWALILPLCLNTFNVIVLRTFFKTTIPDSVVESAKIDGASPVQSFFKITVPLLKPTILLTTIMSTNGTLQLFDESLNLTNGGPGKSTMTLSHYIYNTSFVQSPNFGYAAAMSIIVLIMVAILAVIQMKVGDER